MMRFSSGDITAPLLLFARNDRLDALQEVVGIYLVLVQTDGAESRLVDNVGNVGTTRTGSGTPHLVEVDVAVLDVLEMNLQYGLASLKIWELHDYSSVETAWSQKGFVESLGAVCCREDDETASLRQSRPSLLTAG